MTTAMYAVDGMMCESCMAAVLENVHSLPGVTAAAMDPRCRWPFASDRDEQHPAGGTQRAPRSRACRVRRSAASRPSTAHGWERSCPLGWHDFIRGLSR